MTYRAKPSDGVAWVTGASSGIGRETARELARRGYTVAVTARRLDDLEGLAQEVGSPGGRIVAHAGDVTDAARMAEIVDSVERLHGPIVLAFLNAGTYFAGKERVFDMASVKQTLDVNLIGAVHCLGPLIGRMVERGRGQIAINGSVAGYGGLPNAAAYGASKAALIHLAESLKFTLDPAGVTIQIVNPGFVETPLTDQNPFPMPFLMKADAAVRRICDGFERGGFEITFPRRLAWILKAVNHLPYAVYFPLLARATGGRGKQG
jgi:NAD(P)-dependent dehydrogenase (short-subunit alcohol dehydrogenase family)